MKIVCFGAVRYPQLFRSIFNSRRRCYWHEYLNTDSVQLNLINYGSWFNQYSSYFLSPGIVSLSVPSSAMHKRSTEGIKDRSDFSSTDDERGGRYKAGKRKRRTKKKLIQSRKFVIHPNDLGATKSELCTARKGNSTTIALDDSKTERDIREELVEKLPQLLGKRWDFIMILLRVIKMPIT